MIQDLADRVWTNPRFQRAAKAIEKAWLTSELRLNNSLGISENAAARAISATAILACSSNLEHRTAALRLITLGLSRALAIRLTGIRLESEPELDVEEALQWLRTQSHDLVSSGLSPLQINEVREFLRRTDPKVQN